MKIGELANAARCKPETIRFYEKIGLLPDADRTESNYRIYTKKHLERLIFIRNCRSLEMSHEEIRILISIMNQPAVHTEHQNVHILLVHHLQHIDERIAELNTLRLQLIQLQSQDHCCADDCDILQSLADMDVPIKIGKSHV